MATRIIEFYGARPLSEESIKNAQDHQCPFVGDACIKKRSNKLGACALQMADGNNIIICPNRLYANNFAVLKSIADEAFSIDSILVSARDYEVRKRSNALIGQEIIVFGKYFGQELGIPTPKNEDGEGSGSFYIDFILVHPNENGEAASFVAVEVQTIDTTNSYSDAAEKYADGVAYINKNGGDTTKAGLNWENVSKRILPQLIYKGHALRREPMCFKGLFFVVPQAVYDRIKRRVGGRLLEYPAAAGTITFKPYDLLQEHPESDVNVLEARPAFTTTVEQIAFAFVSPQNLPEAGVYEQVIANNLSKIAKKAHL